MQTLGILGAGVMGRALLRGLLATRAPYSFWAATKSDASAAEVRREFGIEAVTDAAPLVPATDIVLLAVKPAQAPAAVAALAAAGIGPQTLIVSVVTGVPIARLEALLPAGQPVIRAMSNTPALVGEAMTVLSPGSHVSEAHRTAARNIFSAVGPCLELDESSLNAVTAISGCGPAYIYLIIEALADAGVRVGLPRDVAMRLVTQTVLGSAKMVARSDRHPAALRDDVTTPAGCTIGALLVLEDGKIRSVLARAIEEATHIANQLGEANRSQT